MYDYDRTNVVLLEWGPRLLAVLAIILAAHFGGKAVQWGLAKLIDRFPGAAKQNAGVLPKQTIGYQLGQLGYWLVLLIGLVAALGVIGLQGVVAPLNTLTTGFLAFVPNIVGAAVIFFVGMLLATITKRVVEMALSAAHIDAWLDKAGLARTTGASGLSKAAGTLVFVLIIIPATIAALEQLGIAAISDPAVLVLTAVLAAIPRVVAALIVLALAFFIGRWVASLIEQLLPSLGFDRMFYGITGRTPPPPPPPELLAGAPAATPVGSPSKVVGQLVLATIVLFSAVEAARLLEFTAIASMLAQVLQLAAHVLFGGVIIAAGVLVGNFLARMIDTSRGGCGQLRIRPRALGDDRPRHGHGSAVHGHRRRDRHPRLWSSPGLGRRGGRPGVWHRRARDGPSPLGALDQPASGRREASAAQETAPQPAADLTYSP